MGEEERCTHSRIEYIALKNLDGTLSPKWECTQCGIAFRVFNEEDNELTALREENKKNKIKAEALDGSQKRIIQMCIKGTVNKSHLSVPEMNVSLLNEKVKHLESEVKRYREALKQCKSWHLADALRFGSDRERKTWQEQMDVIESALSEGGIE